MSIPESIYKSIKALTISLICVFGMQSCNDLTFFLVNHYDKPEEKDEPVKLIIPNLNSPLFPPIIPKIEPPKSEQQKFNAKEWKGLADT